MHMRGMDGIQRKYCFKKRIIEQIHLLLEKSNIGTQSDLKEMKRDMQRLIQAPTKRLRIHGGEESSTSDGGRGAVP